SLPTVAIKGSTYVLRVQADGNPELDRALLQVTGPVSYSTVQYFYWDTYSDFNFAVPSTAPDGTMAVTATAVDVCGRSSRLTQNVLVASAARAGFLCCVGLSPSTVLGGTTSTGTVYLNNAAPAGGTVIALSSSNTALATVPASVTVAAGATSTTFTVSTSSVAVSSSVTISASQSGVTRT